MGAPATPLQGKQVGCYRVLERVHLPLSSASHQRSHWRVRCVCGLEKVVSAQNIMRPFPLRCNHVPEGWRVVGPKEVAVLEACAAVPLVRTPNGRYAFNDPGPTCRFTDEIFDAELKRRSE